MWRELSSHLDADPDDAALDNFIAHMQASRRAHAAEVAYDEKFDAATFGLRAKYQRRSADDTLIAALVRAGLTASQALAHVSKLR